MQIALAILLVWTTSAAFQSELRKLVRVAGPGYEGAVVAGDVQVQSDPRHLRRPEQVWTPTDGDARDLAAGPDKSVFGRTRRIPVRGARGAVTVLVVNAVVASVDELTSLALHVEFRDGS
jgi:hypothetical protein